jgi:hypothetical protein
MQEKRLEASVNALFRRCPALYGFTVERRTELCVSEVTVYPSGAAPDRELYGVIKAALAALIEECPAAGELLRERTFARVFH